MRSRIDRMAICFIVGTAALMGWLTDGAVFPSNLDGVDMGGR